MSFVSVADACRQLGVDAKTLHRWLAQARLPLQEHADDGRKKGLSGQSLQELAALHHRALSSATPASTPALCPLCSQLLVLPELMENVQAQLAALQQHVARLEALLHQSPDAPAPSTPSIKPSRTNQRSSRPAAAHARPAPDAQARPPSKSAHVIARVESAGEGRYVVICPRQGLLPFELESPQWFAWLATQDSFRFVGKGGHFTAHHWWRVPRGAWRAHRHIRNQSYNLRLAPTQELTIAVLEQAAATLQAHLK